MSSPLDWSAVPVAFRTGFRTVLLKKAVHRLGGAVLFVVITTNTPRPLAASLPLHWLALRVCQIRNRRGARGLSNQHIEGYANALKQLHALRPVAVCVLNEKPRGQ
jgi:hypothetical protein